MNIFNHFSKNLDERFTPKYINILAYRFFLFIFRQEMEEEQNQVGGIQQTRLHRSQSINRSSAPAFPTGIACIPSQIHYLQSCRPFTLNVLLFGEAALGKTSMVNGILGQQVFSSDMPEYREKEWIRVRRQALEEQGIRVDLSLADLPELGQTVRKAEVGEVVLEWIREQHMRRLLAESSPDRQLTMLPDTRMHVILYFLNPNAHRLSDLDVRLIRGMTNLANVILVVPKADTLLRHEQCRLRFNIRDQLRQHGLRLFSPSGTPNIIEEPFLCLNGDDSNGSGAGGRAYPWGFVRRTQSTTRLLSSNPPTTTTSNSTINELSGLLFRSFLPDLLTQIELLYEAVREEMLAGETPQMAALEQRFANVLKCYS